MNPAKDDHFQLAPNYYQAVHPLVTALVIIVAWILFPIMALKPGLLSPLVADWMIDIAVRQHSNLLKFLQIHIWVNMTSLAAGGG